jgi:hypothetical protein
MKVDEDELSETVTTALVLSISVSPFLSFSLASMLAIHFPHGPLPTFSGASGP